MPARTLRVLHGMPFRLVLFATLLIGLSIALPGSNTFAAPASGPTVGFPFGDPAYDSGWLPIGFGENTITHNVGGNIDQYYVLLEGRNSGAGWTIGQQCFGSDLKNLDPGGACGIYWHALTTTELRVFRGTADLTNNYIRVRIWVVPNADYDSNWLPATYGANQTLTHGLGGSIDNYLVYLQFRHPTFGVNQAYYGLDTYYEGSQTRRRGSFWRNLTTNQITVWTGQDAGNEVTDIRVRIWRVRTADYDSGWTAATAGLGLALNHNLGGPWNDFVVDLELRDTNSTGFGTNAYRYGGDCYTPAGGIALCEGAFWSGLNANRIMIYREHEDSSADEVRVRIWASRKPKFDVTFDPAAPSVTTQTHNLGGLTDDYVVDLQFEQNRSHGLTGVNQMWYGGDKACGGSPLTLKYVGAYWRGMTSSSIEVHRYNDDFIADRIYLRMWVAPPADYDSHWFPIAQGASVIKTHNLGGTTTDDYIVYLEFRTAGTFAVHHFGYGGDWHYTNCLDALERTGGYWSNLTTTSITLKRENEDAQAEEMRVRIWRNTASDYQSTWSGLAPAAGIEDFLTLEHGLNRDPAALVTYLTFKDTDPVGKGVHHQNYGSNGYLVGGITRNFGAVWGMFDKSSIVIARLADDETVDQVRMRIWSVDPFELALPLITR